MSIVTTYIVFNSLRSSLFRFISGKRESREGSGTEVLRFQKLQHHYFLTSSTGWFSIYFLLRDSENDLLSQTYRDKDTRKLFYNHLYNSNTQNCEDFIVSINRGNSI